MDSFQSESGPGGDLRRLMDERALAILADFRPGASTATVPGTFPGLLQSLEDRVSGLRVIGVCGDNGNAAGARVAEGLAFSAALTGRRTLVIDTNAKSPLQHVLWNGPGSPIGPGLRDIVAAGLPVSPDAIHPTRKQNCRLIPMGYPGDLPDDELFRHPNLERLLGVHAQAMADTVVVSMPSLDVPQWCSAVGVLLDTVLVVLGAHVRPELIGASLDRLLESGTKVGGIVVVPAAEATPAGVSSPSERLIPVFPPPNPFAADMAPPASNTASTVPAPNSEVPTQTQDLLVDSTTRSETPPVVGTPAPEAVATSIPQDVADDSGDGPAVGAGESSGLGSLPGEPAELTGGGVAAEAIVPAGSEEETVQGVSSPTEEGPVDAKIDGETNVGVDDLSSLLSGWRRRSFSPVVPEPVRPGADGPVAEPAWNLLPLEREEWTRGTLAEETAVPVVAIVPPALEATSELGDPASDEASSTSADVVVPVAVEAVASTPAVVEPVVPPAAEAAPSVPASVLESGGAVAQGDGTSSTPSVGATDSGTGTSASAPVPVASFGQVREEPIMDNFAGLGAGTGGSVASPVPSGNPAVFEVLPGSGGRLTLAASTVLTNGRESVPARVELSMDPASLRSMRGTSPDSTQGAMVLEIQVADTRSGCGLRLLHGDDLTAALEVVFEPGAGFRFASGPGGPSAPRISFETTQDGGTLFRAQSPWLDAELLRRSGPANDPSLWVFRLQLAPGR